jgi:hypothetical protein
MTLSHPIRICNLADILLSEWIVHLILLIIILIIHVISVWSFFNEVHGHLGLVVAHSKPGHVIFVGHRDLLILPPTLWQILPFWECLPFQVVGSIQNKGNEMFDDFSLFVMDTP